MREVDKRTIDLNQSMRHTDQTYCGTAQGQVGPVEAKLTALGRVHGIVGAFGVASAVLHSLIHHLAASRVQYAGTQKGRRGQLRSMAGERDRVVHFLLAETFVNLCSERSSQSLVGET